MTHMIRAVALALSTLMMTAVAMAAERVALVIGNSDYERNRLTNPGNDARAVAAEFRTLGFQVIERHDLDKAGFDDAIAEFISALEDTDIAAFYYAGHGNQFPKDDLTYDNYLIPVRSNITVLSQAKFKFVSVSDIQDAMAGSARRSLMFIDACRNNLLDDPALAVRGMRGATPLQGFANLHARRRNAENLISYATSFGDFAADGESANSPYTTALLKHLSRKGATIESILKDVRRDVRALTGNRQDPAYVSDLVSDVILNPESPAPAPVVALADPAPVAPQSPADDGVAAAWAFARDSADCATIEAFRAQFGAKNPFFDRLAEARLAELGKACAPKPAVRSAVLESAWALARVSGECEPVERFRAEYGADYPEYDRLAAARLAELGPACNAKAAQRPVREIVTEIQGILREASCYSGAVDGVWGPRTRTALAEFARKADRTLRTGEPDEAVAEAVRAIKGVTCEVAAQPQQPAKETASEPKVNKTVTKAPVVAPKAATPKATTPKTATAKAATTTTAKPNARTYSYKVWSTGAIPRGSTYSKAVPPYGTLTCTEPLDGHGDRNCSWR